MEVLLPLAVVLSLFALFLWLIDSPRRNEQRNFGTVKRWIKQKGYELPPRIGPGWNLSILIGFLLGIIPGVILLLIANGKRNDYYRELRAFKNKWIEAGMPEG
tara:strand:+ start:34 stop:342 length:309 start_codon:yes stop_codon:yes gene_type:complete